MIKFSKLFILCSILCFVSCLNSNENFSQQNSTDSLKRSEQYIDSLKWLFYLLNIDNEKIWCFDSTSTLQVQKSLFEIEFYILITTEKDSDKIISAEPFFQNGYHSCSISGLETFDRIAIHKNKKLLIPSGCPIKWHHPELIPWMNQDSIPKYISFKENKFKERLNNYKGPINPWLFKEAVKRGVL